MKDLVEIFSRRSLFDEEAPPQSFSVERREGGWFIATEVEKEPPDDVREFQKYFEGKKPSKKPSKKWKI